MSTDPRLHRWLDHMDGDRNAEGLKAQLAEDATFHSPVVHTPQEGREKTFSYLHAADSVFADAQFQYVRTMMDGDNALLEFTAEMNGIYVNGVDIIHWNSDGLIDDFKVMVRPMKAMNMLWEMMGKQLAQMQSEHAA